MLSSMLPTIVLDRTGQPLLVVGARGGPRIISAVMQIVINVVDHQMNIVDAMNAPRVHHQALPDTLRLERNGFTDAQKDSLRALGYAVGNISTVASANAVMRTKTGWVAYSDPRSGGRPAGY
jgi:gamma-glutamyltranspeptidase/glutathione hydrolase